MIVDVDLAIKYVIQTVINNPKQKRNNDNCLCECKKPLKQHACEEDYIWNPSICHCKCDKNVKLINV